MVNIAIMTFWTCRCLLWRLWDSLSRRTRIM